MYSGKSGCIRVKVVVIEQKWLYSYQNCYIRVKVFVFGQGSRNRESSCIRAKLVVIEQRKFFGKKWFYSGNSVSFRAKVIVFGQMWLYSDKLVFFG